MTSKLFFGLLLSILALTSQVRAESFTGSGPDPACGGTSLTIQDEGGEVVLVEYAIFMSTKIMVSKYRPISAGGWSIEVDVYATMDEKGVEIKQRLVKTYRFKSSDIKKGRKVAEELGFPEMEWGAEPARLIQYLKANRKEFEKIATEGVEN